MNKAEQPKIYVAGHRGMVGSALVRNLLAQGVGSENLITRSRQDLDLTNQLAVQEFFARERPDQVYLAAAKVGGIYANNTFPADFIYENLMVQANVIVVLGLELHLSAHGSSTHERICFVDRQFGTY